MMWWWLGIALAQPFGWRAHGDAVINDVTPPETWTTTAVSVETAAWGNGSPVPLGTLVCVTEEPTTLACFDRGTGARVWAATNDWLDTLPADQVASGREKIARAAELEGLVQQRQRDVGDKRRELRRSAGDPAVAAAMKEVQADLERLRAEQAVLGQFTTPPDLDMIGYASPTPVVDGTTVYALFGHGVVSAFTDGGERLWSRWLGPPPRPMTGFDFGSVASPQLVAGHLIVAHATLQALDPATGEVRWTGPAWPHYGTPGVMTIDGVALLLLPDGQVLRASDGKVLAKGLGDIWYTGPVAHGTVGYWVGSKGRHGSPGNAKAWAWDLAPLVRGGEPRKLWSGDLPLTERIYAAPFVDGERLYVVTRQSKLMVLDAATGRERGDVNLREWIRGTPYTSLTRVGDELLINSEMGDFGFLSMGDQPALLRVNRVPGPARAMPLFLGSSVWVRNVDTLMRFDP